MKKQIEAGWAISGFGGLRKEKGAGPCSSERDGATGPGGQSGDAVGGSDVGKDRERRTTKPDVDSLRLRSVRGGAAQPVSRDARA